MTKTHNAAPFWILRNLPVLLCGTIMRSHLFVTSRFLWFRRLHTYKM